MLEGVDGSGKTTAAKDLANTLNAVYYQTPKGLWRKYRQLAEGKGVLIRFLYYLLATIFSSWEIFYLIRLRKKTVICDRYILSTWANHQIRGCRFLQYLSPRLVPIIRPDKTFFLHVSTEEREVRIGSRLANDVSDSDSLLLEKVQSLMMSYPEMHIIGTSDRTPREVLLLIKNCLL